jgi:hypothetical protein
VALRAALWVSSASLLLAVGFLGLVYAVSVLARARSEPASVRGMQTALVIYARVVLVKGLLPQLLLTLALWPALDRLLSLRRRGRLGVVAGVASAAALAALVVAPTLLTAALPGLPAVRFQGPVNFVETVVEMTLAVASACLVPRLLLPGLRSSAPDAGGATAA